MNKIEGAKEAAPVSPWEQIGDLCLAQALGLLKKETAPTAATVETVKGLVETAEIAARRIETPWAY